MGLFWVGAVCVSAVEFPPQLWVCAAASRARGTPVIGLRRASFSISAPVLHVRACAPSATVMFVLQPSDCGGAVLACLRLCSQDSASAMGSRARGTSVDCGAPVLAPPRLRPQSEIPPQLWVGAAASRTRGRGYGFVLQPRAPLPWVCAAGGDRTLEGQFWHLRACDHAVGDSARGRIAEGH